MTAERFYIYRSGATDACALTRKKGEALPPAAPSDRWQFWMQTGHLQTEDDRYGFNLEAALTDIAVKGYSLFTGSSRLLGRPATQKLCEMTQKELHNQALARWDNEGGATSAGERAN